MIFFFIPIWSLFSCIVTYKKAVILEIPYLSILKISSLTSILLYIDTFNRTVVEANNNCNMLVDSKKLTLGYLEK